MLTRLEGIFGWLYSRSCSTFIFLPIFFKCTFVGIDIVVVNVAVLSSLRYATESMGKTITEVSEELTA